MRTELNSMNIIYWQVGDEIAFSFIAPWWGGGGGLLNSVVGGRAANTRVPGPTRVKNTL